MNRITPDAFRHVEDAFIAFCHQAGYEAGRKDVAREDPAYRAAIVRTRSWERNAFDTYAVLPPGRIAFFDQKSVVDRNGGTGYASIELRAIRGGLMSGTDVPSFFVRPPDWTWISAREALGRRSYRGGCCDDDYNLAVDDRWDDLPEKCADQWFRGSGDPWIKVPVGVFKPWDFLLKLMYLPKDLRVRMEVLDEADMRRYIGDWTP